MKKVFYKLLTNKYLWLIVFFLKNIIVLAHDCSSPGDCEETAGYNAAVAIVGGAVALGVGLMGAGFTTTVPEGEDTYPEEGDEEPIDEYEDETEEETAGDEEEYIDTEEEDDNDFIDGEDELSDEEIDELFDDLDDEDDFIEEDIDEFLDEIDAEDDKIVVDKKIDVDKRGDNQADPLDETQKVMDTSNNLKTLIQSAGAQGVKLWQGILKGEEYKKAAKRYKDIIDNLKNKGLNNLANKYASKLNKLLKGKANRLIVTKTKGAKSLFRNLKKIESLGKVADALTFLNNLSKKTNGGKASWDVTTGAAAEELLRYGIKTILTKNPVIAVGDAVLSLAGGPNLDFVIDKSIDKYKEGVTKVADWIYSSPDNTNQKLMDDFKFQKARIQKMNISQAEKNKKLVKVWKILVKHS